MSGNADTLRQMLADLSVEQMAQLLDLQKVVKVLSDEQLDAHLEAVEARWIALVRERERDTSSTWTTFWRTFFHLEGGRAWEREDPQWEDLNQALMDEHEALQAEHDRRAAV